MKCPVSSEFSQMLSCDSRFVVVVMLLQLQQTALPFSIYGVISDGDMSLTCKLLPSGAASRLKVMTATGSVHVEGLHQLRQLHRNTVMSTHALPHKLRGLKLQNASIFYPQTIC